MRIIRSIALLSGVALAGCLDYTNPLDPDATPGSGDLPSGVALSTGTAPETVVRLLDVGKGDAAIITVGNSTVIIDGGPSESRFGELLDSLELNNITIDAVVISHAHLDHFRGLRQLFLSNRNIRINYFFENLDPSGSNILGSIRDSANARMARGELLYIDADDIGSAAAPCNTGSPICTLLLDGGAKLHVMRPMPDGNADDRSVPVKLVAPDSASFTMWFAGDAEQAANEWYETNAKYHLAPGMDVSVLKGQTHGACHSINNHYLQTTNPQWVLFPTGENGKGYVHTQVKDLLVSYEIPWLRTDENGTITIRSPGTAGGGYTITSSQGRPNMDGPYDGTSTSKRCAWPDPPAAPTNLAASVSANDAIVLSWRDNSTTEQGFEVQRHAGDGAWRTITRVGANITSFNDAGLPNATYSYRVRAFNDGGGSSFSNIASATLSSSTTAPPVADPGGPYSATVGTPITFDGSNSYSPGGSLPLSYRWDFGDGNTGSGESPTHMYATAGEHTVSLVVTDADGLSSDAAFTTATISSDAGFTDRLVYDTFTRTVTSGWGQADSGGRWYLDSQDPSEFRVESGKGLIVKHDTGPRNVVIHRDDWSTSYGMDVTGIASFQIDNPPDNLSRFYTVQVYARRDDRASDGNNYYRYRIRAYGNGAMDIRLEKNVDGSKSWVTSNTDIAPKWLPGAKYWVRWDAVGAAPSTRLRMKVWRDGAAEPIAWDIDIAVNEPALDVIGTTGFRVEGPNGTEQSTFPIVFAFDDLDYRSLSSGGEPTSPAAPSNLAATAASTTDINLGWSDNASNEDGFHIERCQGSSCTNFTRIATVSANSTTFRDSGLSAGTTYRYRVQAYNAAGTSSYSNTAGDTTEACRQRGNSHNCF
jgi:beta-lactamase superfamily II metal-dependent hydrolase/PKD repeat protein